MSNRKKRNSLGLYFAGFAGGVGILISAIAFPFVSPAVRKV